MIFTATRASGRGSDTVYSLSTKSSFLSGTSLSTICEMLSRVVCINQDTINLCAEITNLLVKNGAVNFYLVVNAALRASQNGFSFSSL